jgi:hypothetical protein
MSVLPPKRVTVSQIDAALKELSAGWLKERIHRNRQRIMNKMDELLDARNKITGGKKVE